ncbi:phosphoribosylglycinamide formyltransferase [Thermodesulforhabdus norvegica]|uniref:Phosphoribosylglycinamide formyltransferase n=1 Tax=Thermodesulforhabdus norvegica TaxID=39841 RepID=A0A1I4SMQ6_9BACT|nr:phosphoribosylglycinamide formyltransferase [Thermodesulforhabdus norvegica]SFM65756.1 formyltetrahydrofolate-dependent phosphoribosylglycinamide formyltransferase [Thermodesulforhabdus norvegica]
MSTNIAVFVSGSGTNLQAMIDRRLGRADGIVRTLKADIKAVISDRAEAYGLERARKHGIPAYAVDYGFYIQKHRGDREKAYREAEEEILSVLAKYDIDYICLAGYMRLLTPDFLKHFRKGPVYGVINIHPALLPSFPGMHGYEDTFNYGCKWGGITVHFVDEGKDTGPIIAQAVYPIWPDDTVESVRLRGLSVEYELYSQCINWIAEERLSFSRINSRTVISITDPEYERFMRKLTEKALTTHIGL